MKRIIIRLLDLFSMAINKIRFRKNVFTGNGIINKIEIKGRGNKVNLCPSTFNSHVRIIGNNNVVLVEGGNIKKCQFSIKASNCTILIGKSNISNSCFVILDDLSSIKLGRNGYIGGARFVSAGNQNQIQIGDDFLLSDNIELWNSDTHSIIDNSTQKRINNDAPIVIGNKVWIGTGTLILKGVTIGNNCIVGAKSVVTSNVNDNTLVAGIPSIPLKTNVSWKNERIL